MATLVELVLSIAVPIVISGIISRLTRPSSNHPQGPTSPYFFITVWGFLACALGLIWYTAWQWRETWETDALAYKWLIQRKNRPAFMRILSKFMPGTVLEDFTHGKILNVPNVNPTLSKRLQSTNGIFLYKHFGPALSQCEWCDYAGPFSFDLLIYAASRVALTHILNATLITVFSPNCVPEARSWRNLFLCGSFLCFFLDLYNTPLVPMLDAFFGKTESKTFWDALYNRMLIIIGLDTAFAASALLTALGFLKANMLSSSLEVSKRQLNSAIGDLTVSLNKVKLASALRAAIRGNEEHFEMEREYWQGIRDRTAEYRSQPQVAEAVAGIMAETATHHRRKEVQAFVNDSF